MSAQEPRLPGLIPAQAPAVAPRKMAAAVQVDRRLYEMDQRLPDPWDRLGRMAKQVAARQDAMITRVVIASLEDKAHRGVLVTMEDDGSMTAELCGQVPPRTIATMRRGARAAWAANGYPT